MRKLTLAATALLPALAIAHPGPEAHASHLIQHFLLGAMVLVPAGIAWAIARSKR